jgi:hypothetical protein
MTIRVVGALILTATMAVIAACGGSSPESKPAAGGRVFFKEPANGAIVKSPVHVVFASEMFTIAAVPQGEVKEVRANTGHYHLGVDTDCLPVGSVIPKADPWIHFGMGNNTIDMELTPGPHKLVVQAGDDKHATMTGLCETVSIMVNSE